jgi:NAD(P)H-dependent FMN reductase
MKLLGLSGSLRLTSSNAAILRAAARVMPGVELAIWDGVGALPHFSPDLDAPPLPEPVRALRAAIAAADALFVSSPEYAHGMPGSLKNALDWLVSATEALEKPVLLVSASPSGAPHAHAQLAEVLRTMNLGLVDGGAHVFNKSSLDPSGEVARPELLEAIRRGLEALQIVVRNREASRPVAEASSSSATSKPGTP